MGGGLGTGHSGPGHHQTTGGGDERGDLLGLQHWYFLLCSGGTDHVPLVRRNDHCMSSETPTDRRSTDLVKV
jgi:hypothetical protein